MNIVQVLKKEEEDLQKKLNAVQAAIAALNGTLDGGHKAGSVKTEPKRRQLSAAARAKIGRAAKLRWKKFRAEKAKIAHKN